MIPFNQSIKVLKRVDEDDWGKPIYDEDNLVSVECRVDEGSHLTSDIKSKQTGKNIIPDARILIEGLADIKYEDRIIYTDELGNTIDKLPERITVRRDMGGSVILTEILL